MLWAEVSVLVIWPMSNLILVKLVFSFIKHLMFIIDWLLHFIDITTIHMIKAIDCANIFTFQPKKMLLRKKLLIQILQALQVVVHLTLKIQICKSIVKPPETIAKYWFGENCSGSKD